MYVIQKAKGTWKMGLCDVQLEIEGQPECDCENSKQTTHYKRMYQVEHFHWKS